MNIIIRCNAGSQVGFGHLVRCRVLAEEFMKLGHQCIMVGPTDDLKSAGDAELFTHWVARPVWNNSEEEAHFHIELAEHYNSTHFVLDDYRSDYVHQQILRDANLRCLQQYDASKPQKFAAQLIINSSPGEDEEFYRSEGAILNDDCLMLLGPAYSILRPEFLQVKEKFEQDPHPNKKNRILITFGGGDDRGAVRFILESLVHRIPSKYKLIIVVGTHNPRKEKIQQWLDENHASDQAELLISPPSMPEVIASCSLAVLGGGTTTFETAFFGLPMILMPIATNQYQQGIGWENEGAGVYIGPYGEVKPENARQALLRIVSSETISGKMSKNARRSVDGLGISRILESFI